MWAVAWASLQRGQESSCRCAEGATFSIPATGKNRSQPPRPCLSSESDAVSSPDAVDVDWDNRKLVLKATALDPLQMSVLELLRISRFAKVCARPGCPAPYFIADKIIQQYCSDECKYEARKAIQNAYWERRGSRVRRERKQRSKATKRR